MQGASLKAQPISRKKIASAFWLASGFGMALVLVALAFFRVGFYRKLIIEDGLVESGSAWFWLAAVVGIALWLWRNRAFRGALAVSLILSGAFIACGGEEISWGQRIFGFHTPAHIEQLNKQQEFNFHDIGSISVSSNLFFLISLLFFLLPSWNCCRARLGICRLVTSVNTQIFLIGLVSWMLIGVRFGTLGFSPLSLWGYYTQMDDEFFEFFTAFAFAAFAWLVPPLNAPLNEVEN